MAEIKSMQQALSLAQFSRPDAEPHLPVAIVPQNSALLSTFGSQLAVRPSDDGYALTVYSDRQANEASWAVQAARLTAVFPKMRGNAPFLNELCRAVIRNKMTEKQLEDAVSRLIETNTYPTFSIADIVSYDRRVPLMDYGEYCRRTGEGINRGDDFENVKVDGKCYWVLKSDIINARNGVRKK